MMKRTKKSELWYNAYGKEIGGIFLESREAVLRRGGPWPDGRAGLRFMGVNPDAQMMIL